MRRNGHKVRKNVYIYLKKDLNVRIGAMLVVAVNACFFKISCQRKLAWQLYLTDSNRMRDLILVSRFVGVVIAETGEKRIRSDVRIVCKKEVNGVTKNLSRVKKPSHKQDRKRQIRG